MFGHDLELPGLDGGLPESDPSIFIMIIECSAVNPLTTNVRSLIVMMNSRTSSDSGYDQYSNGTYPLVAAIALVMTAVTAIGVTAAMLVGGSDALGGL